MSIGAIGKQVAVRISAPTFTAQRPEFGGFEVDAPELEVVVVELVVPEGVIPESAQPTQNASILHKAKPVNRRFIFSLP